jgi:hypothetical protein
MTKRMVKIPLASSAALLMTLPIYAESYMTVARIPFGFQANGRTMDSGKYEVQELINGVVRVRNATTGRVIYVSAGGGANEGQRPTRLVFHRYGEQYFLSEIWSPKAIGTVLPPSVSEKELIRSGKHEEAAIVLMNSRSKVD